MNHTLELLEQIARGLAAQFGSSCEVVIHDLQQENMESSIIYIENGQVTGRSVGDGPSGVVLEALRNPEAVPDDRLAYLTRTETGRILKSSTLYIRGDEGKVRYIFSLNYDITDLLTAEKALHSLTDPAPGGEEEPKKIITNVNDLLEALIQQSVELVGKPVAKMNKEDKMQAIRYLNEAGAFLITRSGDRVASYFGISKFTLYNYMGSSKD